MDWIQCITWIGILCATYADAELLGDLSHVQIIHRHGDRSPVYINPLQEHAWKQTGIIAGQLSSIGRAQTASFGKYLRQTYIEQLSYLPSTYNNSHLHVRSTDVDRCLMSIQSILHHLYPDSTIPIHVVPQEMDTLLQPTDKCASYVLSYRDRLNEMDEIVENTYGEMIHHMRTLTGWDQHHNTRMSSAQIITIVHDNMVCERAHSIKTPVFLLEHHNIIHNLTRRIIHHRFAPRTNDPRGTVGDGLLADLIFNVENRIASQGEAAKQAVTKLTPKRRSKHLQDDVAGELLRIYSAHDTTLVALATALQLWHVDANFVLPHYAASVIMETRKHGDTYYVNMLYGQPYPTPTENGDTWIYRTQPISFPCPESDTSDAPHPHTYQCPLTHFARLVPSLSTTSTTYSHPGCCLRDEHSFTRHACDAYDAPYASLPSECQLWRRTCPHTSCAAGQLIESGTLNCVSLCSSSTSASVSLPFRVLLLISLIIILILTACLYRRREPPIKSRRGHHRERSLSEADRFSNDRMSLLAPRESTSSSSRDAYASFHG